MLYLHCTVVVVTNRANAIQDSTCARASTSCLRVAAKAIDSCLYLIMDAGRTTLTASWAIKIPV